MLYNDYERNMKRKLDRFLPGVFFAVLLRVLLNVQIFVSCSDQHTIAELEQRNSELEAANERMRQMLLSVKQHLAQQKGDPFGVRARTERPGQRGF